MAMQQKHLKWGIFVALISITVGGWVADVFQQRPPEVLGNIVVWISAGLLAFSAGGEILTAMIAQDVARGRSVPSYAQFLLDAVSVVFYPSLMVVLVSIAGTWLLRAILGMTPDGRTSAVEVSAGVVLLLVCFSVSFLYRTLKAKSRA